MAADVIHRRWTSTLPGIASPNSKVGRRGGPAGVLLDLDWELAAGKAHTARVPCSNREVQSF
ncbi:hypothetical protein VTK73DRAFT_5998 [Phialemonium thermophilum]|uniref:Uncharacterized protein n=1 Tax=Phialemonium thermophilum TaxID=223376 RepID=A0ABR3V062_9PEZI